MFIGDVGQDAWEEVDVLPAGQGGANFGWSIMEGPDCYGADSCDVTGKTGPVATYGHDQRGGCAIVGGYVYRGHAYPALTGAYIYSDDCSGNVWLLSAADAVTTGSATPELVGHLDGNPSAFGQGDDGELYIVDLGGQHRAGDRRHTVSVVVRPPRSATRAHTRTMPGCAGPSQWQPPCCSSPAAAP